MLGRNIMGIVGDGVNAEASDMEDDGKISMMGTEEAGNEDGSEEDH